MTFESILYDSRDGVATITLNRPEKLNAWTPTMESEIRDAFAIAADDTAVRAIILAGAGKGFCAGADMQGVAAGRSARPEASVQPSGPPPLPAEGFSEAVHGIAAEMVARCSPRSMRIIKRQIQLAPFQTLGEAVRMADEEQILSRNSEDHAEGIAHFLEKRAPRFTGR